MPRLTNTELFERLTQHQEREAIAVEMLCDEELSDEEKISLLLGLFNVKVPEVERDRP
jgi:hypothetical protein